MTRTKMGLMTAIALGMLLLAPTLYAHERNDRGQMWGGAMMGHGMWGGPMPGMMGMTRQPGPAIEMMETCQQMMRVWLEQRRMEPSTPGPVPDDGG